MKTIKLHTASPIGRVDIESVTIYIDGAVPELPTLDAARSLYNVESVILATALTDSLPQGTLDRLMIALMERCASLYRGRAGT